MILRKVYVILDINTVKVTTLLRYQPEGETTDMSRLEVKMPGAAQAVVEQLYRNMERRIAVSPPGLCPVDMALNFLNLCQAQTCGKCVPCRIGLAQLSNMIREVLEGEPQLKILDRIEATAQVIVDTADCAIGIDATNLVLMGL